MQNMRSIPVVTMIIAVLITMIEVLSLDNRDVVWNSLSAEWTLLYSLHQPWRIVTSPFLHHDLVQFFNNLVFLCLFGWQVERKHGSVKMLSIFLGALVTSHVICITLTHDWIVGISLGVCGLFGFSLIDNRRTPWWTTLTHRPLHALYFASLIGPLIPFVADMQTTLGFRTSHMSHIGGILYGLAFGIIFLLIPHKPRWRWAIITLPVLLFASQFYSPWQLEWRLVTNPPILLTSEADCRMESMEQDIYVPALVTFMNASTRKTALYWLDYEGRPQFYFSLRPGDSRDQQTFIGHPWCIVNLDSRQALQTFLVAEENQIVTIR
jgi:membrane associated rhomboid family serine protease